MVYKWALRELPRNSNQDHIDRMVIENGATTEIGKGAGRRTTTEIGRVADQGHTPEATPEDGQATPEVTPEDKRLRPSPLHWYIQCGISFSSQWSPRSGLSRAPDLGFLPRFTYLSLFTFIAIHNAKSLYSDHERNTRLRKQGQPFYFRY